ncbi:DMT family transporter, partial [Candidatus Fermentibacteria bacterium]|nr:DMT family transporter [Candidatus Fermentibacteria bacterium]
MRSATRSTVFGLSSVALWATAASAFKLTLGECTPFQAVFAASAVSARLLWAVALARRVRPGLRDLLGALPRGILNPFAYYLILLEAYDRLPAQVAMVINYLWPVTLILLSAAVFGKRLSGRSIGASVLSFSGVVVLAVGNGAWSGRLDATGLALALASTFIWAGYWVLSMKGGGDPVSRLALNFAWG